MISLARKYSKANNTNVRVFQKGEIYDFHEGNIGEGVTIKIIKV